MNNKKYIIFDFDGTLVNSIELALSIYNRIAPQYKCKPIQSEARELLSSKNPRKYFKEYGITSFKLLLLVFHIRKELGLHIADLKPVKDIDKALQELKNNGFSLGILTSNSKKNVEKFMANHNLSHLFDFVYSGRHLLGKDKVIGQILKREQIPSKNVVYVGDETRDVLAMKKAGIPVIAVSWGLTKKSTLLNLKPNDVADNPLDIPILSLNILK